MVTLDLSRAERDQFLEVSLWALDRSKVKMNLCGVIALWERW